MPFSILVFQAFSVCTSSRQWIQQHVPNTSLSLCSMSPQVSPGLPRSPEFHLFRFWSLWSLPRPPAWGPKRSQETPFLPCQHLTTVCDICQQQGMLLKSSGITRIKKHLAQKHHSHPFIAMQNKAFHCCILQISKFTVFHDISSFVNVTRVTSCPSCFVNRHTTRVLPGHDWGQHRS